ncbi:hypothetical protein [Haliangium sp.]|uniref:hypothetical protein n=1 Tax=Haliangium sp. TaxID=2663208 RepID=UPI003D129A83
MLLPLTLACGLLGGCATVAPEVHVLSVAEAERALPRDQESTLWVSLEVVNPTSLPLLLSRLEYRVEADDAAARGQAATGEVMLERDVGADGAAVVEVPVSVPASALVVGPDGSAHCTLSGWLFASADQVERSWPIEAEIEIDAGQLAALRGGVGSAPSARARAAGVP